MSNPWEVMPTPIQPNKEEEKNTPPKEAADTAIENNLETIPVPAEIQGDVNDFLAEYFTYNRPYHNRGSLHKRQGGGPSKEEYVAVRLNNLEIAKTTIQNAIEYFEREGNKSDDEIIMSRDVNINIYQDLARNGDKEGNRKLAKIKERFIIMAEQGRDLLARL